MEGITSDFRQIKNVEWSQVERKIDQISRSEIWDTGYSCYVVGVGGISKSTLNKLMAINGIELVKAQKFILKSPISKLISYLLPSYWGVFEVIDHSLLLEVFDNLTEQAMAELYIISKETKEKFMYEIESAKDGMELLPFVKRISGHFIYVVDSDSYDSPTGVVEAFDWDDKCPKELMDIFELSSFR